MKVNKKLNLEYEVIALYSKIISDEPIYSKEAVQEFKELINDLYVDAKLVVNDVRPKLPGITSLFEGVSKGTQNFSIIMYTFLMYTRKHEVFNIELYVKEQFYTEVRDPDNFNLITEIDGSGLSVEEKWYMMWFLENHEQVYEELNVLIKTLSPTVEKYEEKFRSKVESVASFWQDTVNSGDIKGFFDDKFGLKLAMEIDTFYISMVGNNTMIFSHDIAFIGLQFAESYFDNQGMSTGNATKVLKLLGDVSKYNILKSLVMTKQYGRELAANLDLSAATISYHMQELLNEGLVSVSPSENNRIYYEIRKSKIKEVLEFVLKDLDLDNESAPE